MNPLKSLFYLGLMALPMLGSCSGKSSNQKPLAQPVIDAEIPAGNIVYERISNDTVYVHQDLRDTDRDWFYWAFRARGCQGRTITFIFTQSVAVGVRGPVISFDRGKTYTYADATDVTRNKFTYTFPKDAYEVWMYECFPYTPEMWTAFVKSLPSSVKYDTGVLCQTRKGTDVPYFHIGNGKNKIVMTARHHCSESTAEYVVEGIAAAFAEKSKLGRELRRTFDLTIVPFVDIDGAIAGDQGKGRIPHDHNRDYTLFIYPETAAVAKLMKEKSPVMCFDFHDPWLYGENNEFIYSPLKNPEYVHNPEKDALFAILLEKNQEGGLRYKASDDLPFGVSWNTNTNYSQGTSYIMWSLMNIPELEIARTFEVAFANANGAVVTPAALKEFGHSLARTILEITE